MLNLYQDEKTTNKVAAISYCKHIFVVRKSYKTEKAQDIVVLCFFVVYILCFRGRAKSLNSGAAFCPIFQKTGLELTTSF